MDPFIGEITIFAGNFAPVNFMFCDGRLLAIQNYTALFSLIGTTYGGDGVTTFALPDLRGRIPIHQGQGPGLSNYVMGQRGGTEQVTLTLSQMPSHAHPYNASTTAGTGSTPVGAVAASSTGTKIYKPGTPTTAMNASSIGNAGGNQPDNNVQPFLCLNYIIAVEGIYPSRN